MNTLEESVLQAVDTLAEQANDKTTKIFLDLFKSAILKKYKEAYDQELSQGSVHKETLDKAVDFSFTDTCVSFRMNPLFADEQKESVIKAVKYSLPAIKENICEMLINKGIEVF